MIEYNEELGMIVDYMGLPVTRTTAFALLGMAERHLQHSEAELADAYNAILKQQNPGMANEHYLRTPQDME